MKFTKDMLDVGDIVLLADNTIAIVLLNHLANEGKSLFTQRMGWLRHLDSYSDDLNYGKQDIVAVYSQRIEFLINKEFPKKRKKHDMFTLLEEFFTKLDFGEDIEWTWKREEM